MIRPRLLTACLCTLWLPASAGVIFDWIPSSDHISAKTLNAETGPAGTLSDPPTFDTENQLEFNGAQHVEFPAKSADRIPANNFSVEAEVRIDRPQPWGSIIASSQDNGSYEKGWLLGYNNDRFTFKLSTGGALVNSASPKPFSPGQWAHVIGVYNGSSARLYVDGVLVSNVPVPGAVARPDIPTPFVLGAYKDADEFFPMHGRVRRIKIHDTALPAAEITKLAPRPYPYAVRPSVRFLGPDSAEVTWQSSAPGRGIVVFGTTSKLGQTIESDSDATSHRATITGLLPGTVYHYRIASRTPDGLVSGKVHTFDTALNEVPVDLSTVIPASSDPSVAAYATQTIEKAGFERGFCLVIGLTDGNLLRELARVSGLAIVGVDSDPGRVKKIRQSLHAENLYGPRISITAVADLESLPFTSCLANLIISEQTLAGKLIATPQAEIERLLRPGGLAQLAVNATPTRRPKLDGSGDWSHQYADPANTANTNDKLGGANSTSDYSLQWIGRPGADFGIDRNPRMPAPLSVNG
ncbi:MAG: methyltransferase domain-containing protein, partial [Verrucomicrobiales bacterium]|nr:methyltransferase domain-containing protein [Verrucomicrobiales bacterium]